MSNYEKVKWCRKRDSRSPHKYLILLDPKTENTSATRTPTHAQFVSPEEPNQRPIVAIRAHGDSLFKGALTTTSAELLQL
jgi:hypothetical protein